MKSFIKRAYRDIPLKQKAKIGEIILNGVNKMAHYRLNSKKRLNGPGLTYWEAGNPRGEVIFFVHGFADNKDSVITPSLLLKEKYRIIAPDLPSFGDNPYSPDQEYSILFMANQLLELMDELQINNFHLVANSLGGAIAMEMALNSPEKVKSLCLINTAGFFFDDLPGVIHHYLDGNNFFNIQTESQYRDLLNKVFHKENFIPSFVFPYFFKRITDYREQFNKVLCDLTSQVLHRLNDENRQELIDELSYNEKAKDIKTPALIIWGTKDQLFNVDHAHRIQKIIESSEVHIIKKSGHAPHVEKPKEFVNRLDQFIENVCKL